MSRVACTCLVLIAAACGGATSAGPPPRPTGLLRAPTSQSARADALRSFAERAFQTLQVRAVSDLLADDGATRRLLTDLAARRARGLREAQPRYDGTPVAGFELLRESTFAGACFQGVREEPIGTAIGLQQPGWMFERVLLVGQEPTGRVAVWLEGEFLWTDAGFLAVTIQSPERPRRGHADLELATCDVDLGVHQPLDVVVDGAVRY